MQALPMEGAGKRVREGGKEGESEGGRMRGGMEKGNGKRGAGLESGIKRERVLWKKRRGKRECNEGLSEETKRKVEWEGKCVEA